MGDAAQTGNDHRLDSVVSGRMLGMVPTKIVTPSQSVQEPVKAPKQKKSLDYEGERNA